MIVCVCNNVNSATIESAVEMGATTIDAVRETTCAGKCQFKVNRVVQDTLADSSCVIQAATNA